ncbi:MAG TPA: T9SS type A sorting domain-containing protein [Puia sp.]|nr:T9SS type A sorting domain-containing protein [Puia sp.]
MKKIYLFCLVALLGFINIASAQTYTAVSTGNWSNASIWDINGVPSNPCTNCTITINPGVTVTVNLSVTLNGTSSLKIGPGATALNPSKLLIPASGAIDINSGNNVILVYPGTGSVPTVTLANSHAFIDASAAGNFDGIFNNFINVVYSKLVGNAPSVLALGTWVNNAAPVYGNGATGVLSNGGPATISSNGTLPIFLTKFYATLDGKLVDLSWQTTVEINSDHFSIERSADEGNWESIGTVAAKGYSDIQVTYSFVDQSPLVGANYYRLKMVDKDGRYKYSDIVGVRGAASNGISVYPNPVSDIVNVSIGYNITGELKVVLMNQVGQVLQQKQITNPAGSILTLQVGGYPQGTYILQVTGSNGSRQVNKLLITH